ncbi:DUF4865 family protein [Bacillus sp. ISL-47]|uniref:DUF4865 family protein n=1 Tax=Bacillus sp. ISL-47 TaxID=2819130 RepID=UPI001BEC0C14|nr:DUF4865 family protein [Bacillus sp. ISL-47]MBT2686727.1 DUF4865 family protein [Bacillus sp. ISL-47]MBT2706925.1 DUF4865 family protein [Pseudomonas sp. ISL-84]
MIAAQYKITLPSDYDMQIIKARVKKNAYKTDGFQDLKFKLYLITEKGINDNNQNSYCPLYLWKDSSGLNKFLFDGFYDNILNSFGWQRVNVGIPLIDTTSSNFTESNYLYHITGRIQPQESLLNLKAKIAQELPVLENTYYLVTYNPDKWEYEAFYFLTDLDISKEVNGVIYKILHISQ